MIDYKVNTDRNKHKYKYKMNRHVGHCHHCDRAKKWLFTIQIQNYQYKQSANTNSTNTNEYLYKWLNDQETSAIVTSARNDWLQCKYKYK